MCLWTVTSFSALQFWCWDKTFARLMYSHPLAEHPICMKLSKITPWMSIDRKGNFCSSNIHTSYTHSKTLQYPIIRKGSLYIRGTILMSPFQHHTKPERKIRIQNSEHKISVGYQHVTSRHRCLAEWYKVLISVCVPRARACLCVHVGVCGKIPDAKSRIPGNPFSFKLRILLNCDLWNFANGYNQNSRNKIRNEIKKHK